MTKINRLFVVLFFFLFIHVRSLFQRPLDLVVDRRGGSVNLVTSIDSFRVPPPLTSTGGVNTPQQINIRLFSMLHVADKSFYEEIDRLTGKCDYVLFELITQNQNTLSVSDTPLMTKRKLGTDVTSLAAEALAADYKLSSQMSLNLRRPNWYIADLDTKSVESLKEGRKTLWRERKRVTSIAGRAAGQRVLSSFFLDDSSLITFLRLLTWLAPCPELSCIVLDWARLAATSSRTKPGGLPLLSALVPIARNFFAGNIFMARKIAFAQRILSGVVDGGEYGEEAASDVGVMVGARNSECMRMLNQLIEEIRFISSEEGARGGMSKKNEVNIAILYGAFHTNDLRNRLINQGYSYISISNNNNNNYNNLSSVPSTSLSPPPGTSNVSVFPPSTIEFPTRLTAWEMSYPTTGDTTTPITSKSSKSSKSSSPTIPFLPSSQWTSEDSFNKITSSSPSSSSSSSLINISKEQEVGVRFDEIAPVAGLAVVYLLIGTLDWFVLFDILTDCLGKALALSSHFPSIDISMPMSLPSPPPFPWPVNIPPPITPAISPSSSSSSLVSPFPDESPALITSCAVALAYGFLYVKRHRALLSATSSVGIEWDKPLF